MKRFRKPFALIPLGILIIGGAVYLKTLPTYDGPWEQEVFITQKQDAQNQTAVEFMSSGYLQGIKAEIDGRMELLDGRRSFRKFDRPLEMDWLKEDIITQTEDRGNERFVHLNIRLDLEKQPYQVTLRLKSDRPFTVENANVRYRHRKNRATISWSTHPPQILEPEIEISLPPEGKLEAEIVATFLETPLPVSCQAKNIHFIHRAELTRKAELLPEK